VRVDIGYGMPHQDNRSPSKAHLNVIQKFDNVAKRFRHLRLAKLDSHAKILLVDTTFFVIGSFNWLSFHGDPDRPFRDEQSVLVSMPNMIERKYRELNNCFSE
jgi:phosphatidylserine/phosphatidylglycerophosphate/cardiolipin synthase-like enzyme